MFTFQKSNPFFSALQVEKPAFVKQREEETVIFKFFVLGPSRKVRLQLNLILNRYFKFCYCQISFLTAKASLM